MHKQLDLWCITNSIYGFCGLDGCYKYALVMDGLPVTSIPGISRTDQINIRLDILQSAHILKAIIYDFSFTFGNVNTLSYMYQCDYLTA